jgi:hypothetical protein
MPTTQIHRSLELVSARGSDPFAQPRWRQALTWPAPAAEPSRPIATTCARTFNGVWMSVSCTPVRRIGAPWHSSSASNYRQRTRNRKSCTGDLKSS